MFVQASLLLTMPMITVEAVERGYKLLLEFCAKFESLYVTPNMHLHTHLVDCIKDFGPVYSFWLFSFERYNGLLGSFRTNQRSVELQLMRRFTTDAQIHDMDFPKELTSEETLDFLVPKSLAGTLSEVSSQHSAQYLSLVMASNNPILPTADATSNWTFIDIYEPGGVKSTEILNEMETLCLCQSYNSMYPGNEYTSSSISSAIHPIKSGRYGLWISRHTDKAIILHPGWLVW